VEICDFKAVDPETIYLELPIQAETRDRPFTAINMVSTVDGKATLEGHAGKIGSRTDRVVMRKVRAAYDVLMYGVGTLRAENVNPRVSDAIAERRLSLVLRPQPLRVVISASGNLPLDNKFFECPDEELIVFTTAAAGAETIRELREHGQVFVVGEVELDLHEVMRVLAQDLGIRSVLAEGGPSLNYSLFKERLVDEFFLTLAPRVFGGQRARTIIEGPEFLPEEVPAMELLSVYRAGSELYLRYRVLGPVPPPVPPA
jgi:2,5-diamino-6-(ribosylamino)-4(3H)-pyrimidinone 5'-phosphate reductase